VLSHIRHSRAKLFTVAIDNKRITITLQVGHFVTISAQVPQTTECPHGRNVTTPG